jgi:hypothetical protein
MSKELNWSKDRQMSEFNDAKHFLTSMGLHPSLEKISFEDVKNGRVPSRRSLGEDNRTKELTQPGAGSKEERRQIPVERSGGGT